MFSTADRLRDLNLSKKISLRGLPLLFLLLRYAQVLLLLLASFFIFVVRTIEQVLCQLWQSLVNQWLGVFIGDLCGGLGLCFVTYAPAGLLRLGVWVTGCGGKNGAQKRQRDPKRVALLVLLTADLGVRGAGFLARNAEALAAFPQALAADAQFACQLGFGHMLLMFEHEVLEVILKG